MNRSEMRAHLWAAESAEKPFWGIGAGPETAAAAETAGAAWLVANHTVALPGRIPGSIIGLMPFADANGEIIAMGPDMLDTARAVPVLAGAFAADQFRTHAELLRELRRAGYEGIQNFPSTGMAEGKFRGFLLDSDMGYDREVALMRMAAREGFFTSALVFSPEQADDMLHAGVDMLVAHPGFTADGEHRLWSASAREMYGAISVLARENGNSPLVVRSSFDEEEWPPRVQSDGIGIQYDGNYREGQL